MPGVWCYRRWKWTRRWLVEGVFWKAVAVAALVCAVVALVLAGVASCARDETRRVDVNLNLPDLVGLMGGGPGPGVGSDPGSWEE